MVCNSEYACIAVHEATSMAFWALFRRVHLLEAALAVLAFDRYQSILADLFDVDAE